MTNHNTETDWLDQPFVLQDSWRGKHPAQESLELLGRLSPEAKAAILAKQAEAIQAAELYGRLHQTIELFQSGELSAARYGELHAKQMEQITELQPS